MIKKITHNLCGKTEWSDANFFASYTIYSEWLHIGACFMEFCFCDLKLFSHLFSSLWINKHIDEMNSIAIRLHAHRLLVAAVVGGSGKSVIF